MSKSSNFSHWLGVRFSGFLSQTERLPASSGWSLRSWRRTFSTALLTRLTTWNLSKVTWALGRLATIPLAKACDMSALTSVTALGSPPWALRSSAKAATVEATLPGVANNTLRCSRSTKRETYFWPRREAVSSTPTWVTVEWSALARAASTEWVTIRQIRVSCSLTRRATARTGMDLAGITTNASNSKVKLRSALAQGTATRWMPQREHSTRGVRAWRKAWCWKKFRCRQVRSSVS